MRGITRIITAVSDPGRRSCDRRSFLAAAALPLLHEGRPAQGRESLPPGGTLTDVEGLKVGHATDTRRPTGCTVVLTGQGAVAGVDVRGGAPGTRETALLDPVNVVGVVHAVVLAGGSAFGLDAASGVVRFLEEKGVGLATGPARVPIVPAAVLFDLDLGDARIRPDAQAGYAAARAAGGSFAEGSVGAGAGATVGKMWGLGRAMKGGLGTASVRVPGGVIVGALVAVNAFGDVVEPDSGRVLAGARSVDGERLEPALPAILAGAAPRSRFESRNTTIGVVATNARLDKSELTRVARMAQDGLARTIVPVHTPSDGDTVFALATGSLEARPGALVVGTLAAEVLARAIVRAVRLARGLPGLPACGELPAR